MKNLLCVFLLLMLCGLAFGQTGVPVCDPNHTTNCTDYFGAANWANSALPAGSITGFKIMNSGGGYVNPAVVITDPTGINAAAGAVTLATGGAITGIAVANGGTGYIAAEITVVDLGAGGTAAAPTCGPAPQPACGSGALVTPIIGGTLSGGIRKFLDPMPSLALGSADITTFPGSDYYVIALVQYTTKMHTDLPPTTLRGYCQIIAPATTCTPSYLGPTILAQKNRPVRVLFKNLLPTGLGGNLFIPTDTTYMGSDPSYTQNRATLHLHGGASPWISDGTAHQWTVPVGETATKQRGDSVQMVPDMWFDATTRNVIASCAGHTTCAVANSTIDPGQGALTFYWTNQQGGRLMFYHDHALGLTRLNVYAGEAAGYLLYDPAEETALAAATVPGTITSAGADLAHLIPMVIQDKTFVPNTAQLAAQDPTWIGNFGTAAASTGTGNGDLWLPHIYMTNQNPADPSLTSAVGRWDYGAWFFPPQTTLTAATPTSAVTVPCTSSAFPNQIVQCPITPNPSGTPEGFMDTPVVNGKAYPVLHVAPAAYRFKLLSAGNDRSWNLQWYVADPTVQNGRGNTEVKMLPASVPLPGAPAPALPLCTTANPVGVPGLIIGLVTAVLDSAGNPVNGTGLPAGCWPSYGAAQGIPALQTMWPADGRTGGVPDPTLAGPPFIQIGTEGGLLPAPVVIPSTPTGYEANPKSITIGSVSMHGLWLGPAERADAIVDFSAFGGKTLILYNDAPSPAPAVDSRTDYFTGDLDNTPIGGAPSTQAGYGPNTRTLVQVIVDQVAPNTTPFSLAALQATLPNLFSQTQPPIIVPEPTYPAASGGFSATQAYSGIHDNTLTYYPLGSTTPVVNVNERKAIQELFTTDYGRMNATLGTELPLVNFLTQTTIPLAYVDPPTEIIKQGDTQLWKITHNGVDSHWMHFHLFNVQVVNRVGWDGSLRPPDVNELGWKDTVRMNPLEDILVALSPITPVVPFPLRDSYRLLDPTMPAGTSTQFTNINPYSNIPTVTPNAINNFGWEYVWHCHILGHEENDMMRAISYEVPPETPSNLVAAAAVTPAVGVNLSWVDNSASETGFTLQRASDAGFTTNLTTVQVLPITGSTDTNGQGITWGGTQTYNDATATTLPYFYRVQAIKPDVSYWTPSGTNTVSAWSNTASIAATGGAFVTASPTALTFGNLALGLTSPAQTVTLSNTGSGSATINSITPTGEFAVSATTCGAALAANSTCTISVTFTPTGSSLRTGTLIISNVSANPLITVTLTGNGGLPLLTITAGNSSMKYGSTVPVVTPTYAGFVGADTPASLLTQPTCTTTALTTSPVGNYPTTCSGATSPAYNIVFVNGTMSVTQVPLSIWASLATMTYGGTVPTITATYVGFVNGDTVASLTTQPTCTTTATSTNTTPAGKYPSSCSGAVDPNYIISYVNGTVTIGKGSLTITAPSPTMPVGGPVPTLTPTYAGFATGDTAANLTTQPTCITTATASSPFGSTWPVTCSGAASLNYTFAYVAGTLTVSKPLASVTPNAATKIYGGTDPTFTGTLVGFLPADNVRATYSRTPATQTVGTYTISATLSSTVLSPAQLAAKYTITYNTAAFTITRKAASVRPNSNSKSYGTADPIPLTTGTLTGFLGADGVTATYSRTAGEAVGTYTISATLLPTAVLSNYTITYNTATFTIRKVNTVTAITSVSPNPSTRSQGVVVNFTVTPATGPTGTVRVFTSSGEQCTVPVGSGTCTLTMTVAATKTITASYAGDANFNSSNSPTVAHVTNAPTVTFSPTSLTFPTTKVNVNSLPLPLTVSNVGAGALINIVQSITGNNASNFSVSSTTCSTTLAAGASCTLNVVFRPSLTGTRTASIRLTDNAANSPQSVPMTGIGN